MLYPQTLYHLILILKDDALGDITLNINYTAYATGINHNHIISIKGDQGLNREDRVDHREEQETGITSAPALHKG